MPGVHDGGFERCSPDQYLHDRAVAAQEASDPLAEGIPFGTKLQQLAEQRCNDTALTVIPRDGT